MPIWEHPPHPGMSLAIGLGMFRIEEGSDDFCGKLRDDGVAESLQGSCPAVVVRRLRIGGGAQANQSSR